MTEAEWLTATEPKPLIEFIGKTISERKRLLFCCACCHHIHHLLINAASRNSVEATERLADEDLSSEERNAILVAASQVVGKSLGFHRHAARAAHYSLLYTEGWESDGNIRRAWVVAQEAVDATEQFKSEEMAFQSAAAHEIFGNPFRPITINPSWLTSTVLALASGIYNDKAFDRMPILADALQDAGCDNDEILNHCRQASEHCRGCWVVDLLLGKS